MSPPTKLGARPKVTIEIVRDDTAAMRSDEGFLRVRRLVLRNRYDDGTTSREYRYDCAERDAMDAVGIVLVDHGGRVCLRSSIRPPIALRGRYHVPFPEREHGDPTLWEIPAGLVEPGERGEKGLRACCARETMEEVGLEVDPAAFWRLGGPLYLSPGIVAEQIHFFVAEVDRGSTRMPTLDGSPVEERCLVEWVAIDEALAACRDGRIADVKTEVALRRLHERRTAEAGGP